MAWRRPKPGTPIAIPPLNRACERTASSAPSQALILQLTISKSRPDLRIFLLDGHNEYGSSFRESALVLNPNNLKLPFWLFTFEEMSEVIFSGRHDHDEEAEVGGCGVAAGLEGEGAEEADDEAAEDVDQDRAPGDAGADRDGGAGEGGAAPLL